MPISIVAQLAPSLMQPITDLQPGDLLLVCLGGDADPGMPQDILSLGTAYTAVTPPPLTLMDHPAQGDTEYPHHWQPYVMWAAYTDSDWETRYAYVCAWMVTGFTGGTRTISISYDGELLWGRVIRGVNPAVWGHSHVRAVEVSQDTDGYIVYSDFPHTVNIDTDDALVLHVMYPQTEWDPTISPIYQPEAYGTRFYDLNKSETTSPTLYFLRTIPPGATSFTMPEPNIIQGDWRFFPSAVEVWYIILYGGTGGEPAPDEDGDAASRITQVGALVNALQTTGSTGYTGDDGAEALRITQTGVLVAAQEPAGSTGAEGEDGDTASRITQAGALVSTLHPLGSTGEAGEDGNQASRITQAGVYVATDRTGGATGGAGEDGIDASRVTQIGALISSNDTGGSTEEIGEDGIDASRITRAGALVTAREPAGSTGATGEDGDQAGRITQAGALVSTLHPLGSTGATGEDGDQAGRITRAGALVTAQEPAGSTGATGEDGDQASRITQAGALVTAREPAGSTGATGEDGDQASRITRAGALVTAQEPAGSTGATGEDGDAASRITRAGALVTAQEPAGSTGAEGEDGDAASRITLAGFYIAAVEIEIPTAPGSSVTIPEGEEATWGRYWQLAAEGQSLADVALHGAGAAPVISSAKAYSGGYGYRTGSEEAPHNQAAFGFNLPPASTVRCGLVLNHNGVTPSAVTGAQTVTILRLDCAGAPVLVQWNSRANALELVAGFTPGTDQLRRPISLVGAGDFGQADAWHAIGLTARLAAEGGFVSFYLDQKRLLTWTGDTRIYASGSSTPLTQISGLYAAGSQENTDACAGWAPWCYIDDFYADTGDGSEADLPAPFVRFFPRFRTPGAADIKAQMAVTGADTNGAAIGEAPPDDDESYVGASGPAEDIYPLAAAQIADGWSPVAQIAIGYARKTDADLDALLAMGFAVGLATTLAGEGAPLETDYTYVGSRFPQTGDGKAWTQQAIDATGLSVAAAGDF